MWSDKPLMHNLYWTAHGVKVLPYDMEYLPDGSTVPALPYLENLFEMDEHVTMLTALRATPSRLFDASVVVTRDVRRIPLKLSLVDAVDVDESNHLKASYDGLQHFYPIDIYPENIVSTHGVLTALSRVRQQSGFGLIGHARTGSYSFLVVDVSIYWQLLRALYSYTGLAKMRHDLFLMLGFWHPYNYAHIALWTEFRSTFLAPAFFSLFPTHKLLRRPPLVQSAAFLTWLRLAYPTFRDQLVTQLQSLKKQMLQFDVELVDIIGTGGSKQPNPYRHRYIHLLNLQSLFEYAIPVIQDYGTLLKANNWLSFSQAFLRLLGFFVMCNGKGSLDYQRCMYCFQITLQYWQKHALPVFPLLEANHTMFSEESGEIALSILSTSQPVNTRTNLEQVRKAWQLVRTRYDLHELGMATPKKKHREISKLSSFV